MMARETEKYKRSLAGSVGAGMGSLFNASGKTYYILEHKANSKYHKAGESQKIIIDQVELGRDANCQVRFDESFATVSRKHAAIIKRAEEYRIVPLSTTNTTFLNGKPVQKEWYLQSGDEIQLSINGPKMGFIVPQGKQSLVSSIRFTERFSLFRKQALKPYKAAITVLSIFLLLVTSTGVGYGIWSSGKLNEYEKRYEYIAAHSEVLQSMLDSIKNAPKPQPIQKIIAPSSIVADLVNGLKKDVYYIETTCYIDLDGTVKAISTSSGTGFLLNDGRFVTARHCVEPWLYRPSASLIKANVMATSYPNEIKVYAEIKAISANKDQMQFKNSDFVFNRQLDVQVDVGKRDEQGNVKRITVATPYRDETEKMYGTEMMHSTDWAYVKTTKSSSGLSADFSASSNLKAGEEMHVLGFPAHLGVNDGQTLIEPIYNKMSVARDGLNSSGCIMVSQGVAHGNSGGPVFVLRNKKLVVVGIVSRLEAKTQQIDEETGLLLQQQQQYDHMVPIMNIQ